VLKEALPEWIAEPAVAPLVLAFATAAPGDGGVGATYVLLRRERD
jgi:DNA-nicking Smr family endonuclease